MVDIERYIKVEDDVEKWIGPWLDGWGAGEGIRR